MLGFSTVDGFIEVKEGVDEMIKYIANEPSVGLFFVQQHALSSMPYLFTIKDKLVEKVHDVTLHTEDIEDSICVVKLMTECGLPIADEMIKEISKSLHIVSVSQPKRGLITPRTFSYNSDGVQEEPGSGHGYLLAVLRSAKQKATGLGWPVAEQSASSTILQPSNMDVDGPTAAATEADELPVSLSSPLNRADENVEDHDESALMESFNKFRFEREAKLEQWLREE